MNVTLTDSAAARIAQLCTEQGKAMVRLSVDGGGCSGFQYVYGFADAVDADDRVIAKNGAKLVIDAISLPYMDGATIDYIDTLSGAHFKITNPNATSSCGCGTSFSV
jgi:iron-sulfur cluster assembly accessory protein